MGQIHGVIMTSFDFVCSKVQIQEIWWSHFCFKITEWVLTWLIFIFFFHWSINALRLYRNGHKNLFCLHPTLIRWRRSNFGLWARSFYHIEGIAYLQTLVYWVPAKTKQENQNRLSQTRQTSKEAKTGIIVSLSLTSWQWLLDSYNGRGIMAHQGKIGLRHTLWILDKVIKEKFLNHPSTDLISICLWSCISSKSYNVGLEELVPIFFGNAPWLENDRCLVQFG